MPQSGNSTALLKGELCSQWSHLHISSRGAIRLHHSTFPFNAASGPKTSIGNESKTKPAIGCRRQIEAYKSFSRNALDGDRGIKLRQLYEDSDYGCQYETSRIYNGSPARNHSLLNLSNCTKAFVRPPHTVNTTQPKKQISESDKESHIVCMRGGELLKDDLEKKEDDDSESQYVLNREMDTRSESSVSTNGVTNMISMDGGQAEFNLVDFLNIEEQLFTGSSVLLELDAIPHSPYDQFVLQSQQTDLAYLGGRQLSSQDILYQIVHRPESDPVKLQPLKSLDKLEPGRELLPRSKPKWHQEQFPCHFGRFRINKETSVPKKTYKSKGKLKRQLREYCKTQSWIHAHPFIQDITVYMTTDDDSVNDSRDPTANLFYNVITNNSRVTVTGSFSSPASSSFLNTTFNNSEAPASRLFSSPTPILSSNPILTSNPRDLTGGLISNDSVVSSVHLTRNSFSSPTSGYLSSPASNVHLDANASYVTAPESGLFSNSAFASGNHAAASFTDALRQEIILDCARCVKCLNDYKVSTNDFGSCPTHPGDNLSGKPTYRWGGSFPEHIWPCCGQKSKPPGVPPPCLRSRHESLASLYGNKDEILTESQQMGGQYLAPRGSSSSQYLGI